MVINMFAVGDRVVPVSGIGSIVFTVSEVYEDGTMLCKWIDKNQKSVQEVYEQNLFKLKPKLSINGFVTK